MPENKIHDGHRKRLKERFLLEGLDHFNEINVLELLLFYCVQRKDTNPLAHRLLDHFGSITGVMNANADDLMQVQGVTEHIAAYLTLLAQFGRYHAVKAAEQNSILTTTDDCGRYMVPFFHSRTKEAVAVACLDAKCQVLCCKIIAEGGTTATSVTARAIAEVAFSSKAVSVVLAHNHPGGFAIPSSDDLKTTEHLAQALKAMDIILADHIVVCGSEYISLMNSCMYTPSSSPGRLL